MLIPNEWKNGRPVRTVCHWTGGAAKASLLDRAHYHILIEQSGVIIRGLNSIAANDNCDDGNYAAHTGEMNTRSIGIALCGMAGAVQNPLFHGTSPINKRQWDTLIAVCAELCEHYRIEVSPRTVLMHSEVKATYRTKGNGGKWDISVLPFARLLTPANVYHKMRSEIIAKMSAN